MNSLVKFTIFCCGTVAALQDQEEKIEIRKCCGDNEILNLNTKQCTHTSRRFAQKFEVTSFQTNKTILVDYEYNKLPHKSNKSNCDKNDQVTFKYNIFQAGDYLLVVDQFNTEVSFLEDVCFDNGKYSSKTSFGADQVRHYAVAQKCLDCSPDKPCVNFCCGKEMVKIGHECVPRNESMLEQDEEEEFADDITFVNVEVKCDDSLYVYEKDQWMFTKNGVEVDGEQYALEKYCIDRDDEVALVCRENVYKTREIAKVVVMSISVFCIFVYMILHCIPEELRTNHSTAIKIPFCFFLALSYIIVIVITTFRSILISSSSCIILGLLLQFSMISVFFWLSCLSFDVLMRFRKIQDFTTEVSRNHIYYSISIICPALITLATLVLQFFVDPDDEGFIHPGIGDKTCFFGQYKPQLIYYHLITMILLTLNLIMFVVMAILLARGPWKLCRVSCYHIKIISSSNLF